LDSDTIAAISTSVGIGGIGIVRISGDEAFEVIERIFQPHDASFDIQKSNSHVIKYGKIVDFEDQTVDEVLVSFFKAPKSYTKENVVEINCHGGNVVIRKILDLAIKAGARIAQPGEFTKRAFLNGRIDLTQAEAVIDMINSKTDKAREASVKQLEGFLKDKIQNTKNVLTDILVDIEAGIDYPDAEIEEITKNNIISRLSDEKETLLRLYNSFDEGKILRDGIRTLIIGKPNVGKSSLMNYLLRENRAIVTDIPGTTRDTIEEMVNIKGIPLVLIDTAGIRQADNLVEEIGIKKALELVDEVDLVIAIFDASSEFEDEDKQVLEKIQDKKSIILLNKIDKYEQLDDSVFDDIREEVIRVSIKEKENLDEIEDQIEELWRTKEFELNDEVVVSNVRHKDLIYKSIESIEQAQESLSLNMPLDIISIDIKDAVERLAEITGENVTEEVIDGIFSRFCLGK